MEIKRQKTRTLFTKDNGRSSDAVSPNFIYSCLGGCRESYCYVMRNHHAKKKVFINENTDQILSSIQDWLDESAECKTPNQTDPKYYTIDIGCSTDIPLMWKYYNWNYVFDWFKNHPMAKATFATKYVQYKMLDYNPNGKIRIRFSLMPQTLSDKIEPNTSKIADRLKAIKKFYDAGYEVHLNFSPIVYYNGWLNDYRLLFQHVNCYVPEQMRESVKSE
ncbi:MAG: spore photoproduct lyase family protein, partial [bacterium]